MVISFQSLHFSFSVAVVGILLYPSILM
uniref:Uncharacterized protein n=1 Tax=Arundo donax TaxID=35708 RepID=A0A0A9EKR5_ARUDO